MSEHAPVPRPVAKVGDYDWITCPDLLFSSAFDLAVRAKRTPVFGEGLRMVMALKKKELKIMALQATMEDLSDYQKVHGEDAFFVRNRRKLCRQERRKTRFLR